MFHPTHTFISKFVTTFEAKELHHDIFIEGECVYHSPSLQEIQQFTKDNLDLLWDEYKRGLNPE